jgi:hypothetical protein
LFAKYYSGNQIERDEMGGACSTFGERRRGDRILMGNLEETDHLEDKRIDERIILK